MDKLQRVASYIVAECRESMGDAEALEFLSSPIDCALYADDVAEQVEDLEEFEGLSPQDFASFDPRTCKASALAMVQALEDAEG